MFLGDFPKEQEIRELAVKIAAEALTNAVRHADARKLRIESKKENGWQILSFQNDGNKPKGPIEPVGGLAGLIRQMEEWSQLNGRQGLALLLNLSVPASKGTDKFERKSAERQAYGKYKKKKISHNDCRG